MFEVSVSNKMLRPCKIVLRGRLSGNLLDATYYVLLYVTHVDPSSTLLRYPGIVDIKRTLNTCMIQLNTFYKH